MDLSKLVLFFFNNTAAPAIYTLSLHDALPILYTRARYLPPSKVEESEINDSIISDGCIINGAKVTNSVVGLRSRISKGVQMDGSYMMGADIYQTFEDMRNDLARGLPRIGIGEGTIVKHAIIDKNVRIGKNARLLNEAGVVESDGPEGSYFIRDSIIIFPKNAVIADGTVI